MINMPRLPCLLVLIILTVSWAFTSTNVGRLQSTSSLWSKTKAKKPLGPNVVDADTDVTTDALVQKVVDLENDVKINGESLEIESVLIPSEENVHERFMQEAIKMAESA
jgi:hypothetical protein